MRVVAVPLLNLASIRTSFPNAVIMFGQEHSQAYVLMIDGVSCLILAFMFALADYIRRSQADKWQDRGDLFESSRLAEWKRTAAAASQKNVVRKLAAGAFGVGLILLIASVVVRLT